MANHRASAIKDFATPFLVKPGSTVKLAEDFDPGYKDGLLHKDEGDELLQGRRRAPGRVPGAARGPGHLRPARRAPGARRRREGRHDPPRHERRESAGRRRAQLQGPLDEELDHDFLWRYAQRCPPAGRSASSTARTTRRCSSSGCTPRSSSSKRCRRDENAGELWKRRFREINDWERYLTDNGFRIVKLFLNLSKEEQRRRFLARIDEPEKNWKFSADDIHERQFWDDYQRAFSEMLSHTSTERRRGT